MSEKISKTQNKLEFTEKQERSLIYIRIDRKRYRKTDSQI